MDCYVPKEKIEDEDADVVMNKIGRKKAVEVVVTAS